LVKPLGIYLEKVFTGSSTYLRAVLQPAESFIYRLAGVDPNQEQTWRAYAISFIAFTVAGTLFVYGILREQSLLPFFDPKVLTTPMTPDLAMNTAISFQTTSTWQAYGGETTMSYLSQMALCSSNFMAGAAGLAVGIAFIRGLAREKSGALGNFWVDVTRALLYVLLPLSLVGAALLIRLGVPMNFLPYTQAATVEGARQIIAQGPVACLEIIKNLGTNGGGFLNASGSHPFETPNNAANLLNMLAIVALPAALTHTFGIMTGRKKDGWVLLGVMVVLFGVGLAICDHAEGAGNPLITALHVSGPNASRVGSKYGREGDEIRHRRVCFDCDHDFERGHRVHQFCSR
jgi:K+-transporting ATPase ATPase A chain